MGNKIVLNDIINKMNKAFPNESLTELEKARYLYIELGKLLRFDVNFVSAHDKKIRDNYWKEVNFDDIEGNEFTCKQISEIYAELLRRAEIQAEAIYKPELGDDDYDFDTTGRHKYTKITLKTGECFIADLVYDLPFIQKDLQPLFFGTLTDEELLPDVITLNQNDLIKVDEKIGYVKPMTTKKNTFTYMDDFIEMLRKDFENEEHLREYVLANYSEKDAEGIKDMSSVIKYKIDAICRFFTISDMGFREGNVFLNKILHSFFSSEEKQRIACRNLISEHEDWSLIRENNYEPVVGNTDLIRCWAIRKATGEYEYFIYEQGKNLEPIEKEEFERKLKKDKYKTICAFFKNVSLDYKSIPGLDR